MVAETWISAADTAWNIDTPALWVGDDSAIVLVTGKATHAIHAFDAATGAVLPTLGSPGSGPGQFLRPNGIATLGDLVFVVERDNHRVQVLRMPEGRSIATFGADELIYPYGITIEGALPDPTLWITDDYQLMDHPDLGVAHRIHRFGLDVTGRTVSVTAHAAYGGEAPEGALTVVETLWVDEADSVLMVADETQRSYLVFDLHGRPTGTVLARGDIGGDPEGLALVRCGPSRGYWIATDQRDDVSLFHVYERGSLRRAGTFRGERTANTDGVSFAPGPVPGFLGGVFFAVHDDQALVAFAWEDILDALELDPGCRMPTT